MTGSEPSRMEGWDKDYNEALQSIFLLLFKDEGKLCLITDTRPWKSVINHNLLSRNQ